MKRCRNKTCCCRCKNHKTIYSHPWVDGKSITDIYGYICDATKYGMNNIIISNEHGECELWMKKEKTK
jgi:hypothetical protein